MTNQNGLEREFIFEFGAASALTRGIPDDLWENYVTPEARDMD